MGGRGREEKKNIRRFKVKINFSRHEDKKSPLPLAHLQIKLLVPG